MVVTSTPLEGISLKDIFAATADSELPADEVPVSKDDAIMTENTKNSTTFDIGDGKKKVVYYGADVRYEDENGELVDYDPALTQVTDNATENGEDLSGYAYENTTGDKKQYFPQTLSTDSPVLLENGEYNIKFSPLFGTETQASEEVALTSETEEENNEFSNVEEATTDEIKEEITTDDYDQEVKKPLIAVYDAGTSMDIEYQSLDNGVKENVVLEEKPESGVFQYEIKAGDLIVRKNGQNEGITFYQPDTDEIVAFMAPPNMNDATKEAYSEEVTCDVMEKEGEPGTYILTMSVNEDYLNDSARQYPVTIDPTLTWKGDDSLRDVYVISGSTYGDINFYDSGVVSMMAGKTSKGVYRTYLMFMDLYANTKGKYIDSATLTMYETASSKSGQTISAHKVNKSWKSTELTWNSRPSCNTSYYSSVKTTGTTGKARTLDLTTYVKNVASGSISNYGIMLRNQSETSSYGQFYGARHGTAANRPKLSVVYYDKPTLASKVTVSPEYGQKGSEVTVNWSGITSKSLDYIQYRIARVDSNGDEVETVVPYSSDTKIGTTSSGSARIITPSPADDTRLNYKIFIRGVDTQGNVGTGKGVIFHMDSAKPSFSSKGINPNTTAENPTTVRTPTISWSVSEVNLAKMEYLISLNGSTVGTGTLDTVNSGTATLPAQYFSAGGDYSVRIRATDKANNATTTYAMHYYVEEQSVQLNDYLPSSGELKLRQQYGKNTLDWSAVSEEIPNNVTYRIHRGTTAGFITSDSTVVADGISEKHWTDMNTIGGQTYYYKLEAVQNKNDGSILAGKTASDTMQAAGVTEDEYKQHTGSKNWQSYFTFDTPIGNGTIEESSGNLSYNQKDIELPAEIGTFALERNYNSQWSFDGMFGKGWMDSFHKELNTDQNGNIYFTDSEGTQYLFEKSGNNYSCKESEHYELFTLESDGVTIYDAESPGDEDVASSKSMGYMTYRFADGEEEVRYHAYSVNMDGALYRLNKKGRIVAEVDVDHNFLLYNYNSDGTLKSVTTSAGKQMTFEYDSQGHATKVMLPDQTYIVYTYDSNQNLTKVKRSNCDGSKSIQCTYQYGSNGMVQITDFEQNTYDIVYSNGKVVKVTYPDGEKYELAYEDGSTSVTKTGAGQTKAMYTTSTDYEAATGKVLSETDTAGLTTEYRYGNSNNPYLATEVRKEKAKESLKNGTVVFETFIKKEVIEHDNKENIKKDTVIEGNEDPEVTEYTYGDTSSEWTEDEATEEKTYVSKDNGQTELIDDITYTYDDYGHELQEEDTVSDEITTMTYDDDGNVISEVTTDDGVIKESDTMTYDKEGNVEHVSNISGSGSESIKEIEDYTYDIMGREITSVDEQGNKVTTSYDWLGRATKTETEKKMEDDTSVTLTETKSYHENGTVDQETDSQGVTTTYLYDSQGRVVKTTQTEGSTTKVSTNTYGYDTITVQEGTGTRSVYVYKETKITPDGTSTTYTDANGITVRESAQGVVTDYIVKNGKSVGTVIDGAVTLSLQDEKGQETGTIELPQISNGSYTVGQNTILTENMYDDQGNVISSTDAKQIKTAYEYDDEKRVTKVTEDVDGKALVSSIAYSANTTAGTFSTTVTDPKGHKNIETTSGAELTIETKDEGDGSDAIITSLEYDDQGNVTKESYSDGNYKTYEYSSRNLLKTIRYYEESQCTLKTDFVYDELERLTRMSDYEVNGEEQTPYRHTLYGYDSWGRKSWEAEVDTTVDASAITDTQLEEAKIKYNYDGADRISKITYAKPSSSVQGIRIGYDEEGRINHIYAVVKNGSSTTENILRSYVYDAKGCVTKMTDYADFADSSQNAVVRSYTYDDLGRAISMIYKKGDQTIGEYHYTYDKSSQIIKAEERDTSVTTAQKDQTKDYTYDSLGQLIQCVVTDHHNNKTSTTDYVYDDAGNRTSMTKDNETTVYTYNALDQLTQSITVKDDVRTSACTYTYDANGNQISESDSVKGTSIHSSYDVANRLSSQTITKDGSTILAQENRYNGDDQRIEKKENGQSKIYHYQNGMVSYVTDSDGMKTMQYLGNDGSVIGAEEYTADTSKTSLYNKDIQNSTVSLLDDSLNGTTSYTYDAFGQTTVKGTDSSANEVCYTGGIYDESTGLYYLNARYYDPEDGRFLTQDTYRGESNEPDTYHLYAYCANDPVNYVDPSGHKKKLIGAGVQVSVNSRISFVDVGVGIEIIYFFKQITSGVYAYWYKEAGTSTSSARKSMKKLYKLITKKPSKILSKPLFNCAICLFAVNSEKYNKTVKSYEGTFRTKGASYLGWKGFISTGGGFRTVGAGKSFGNSGLWCSKSKYYYIGNASKMFNSLKKNIKKKASKYFDK